MTRSGFLALSIWLTFWASAEASASNTPRSLTKGNAMSVNVVDFGAIPDDGKDDAPAFRAAEQFAAKGAEIVIPAGTYHIATSVPVTKKVQWVGAGGPSRANGTSKLIWTGVDNGKMFVLAEGPAVVGITFSGLTFADGATPAKRCRFLVLDSVQSAVIERNTFLTSYVGYAVDVLGASYFNTIRDNRFEDTGVRIGFDANATEVAGNHFFANPVKPILSTAIRVETGVNGLRILANTIEGHFGSAGIDIERAVYGSVQNNRVEAYSGVPMRIGRVVGMNLDPNFLFRSGTGPLVEFYGSSFTKFEGNAFSNHNEGGQSMTLGEAADHTLRDEKLATGDLADFNFKHPQFVQNVAAEYTKDGRRSDRPFLTLKNAFGPSPLVILGSLDGASLPIKYVQDQGMWITFSVLADARTLNVGNPSIHIETGSTNAPPGYVPERSYIPKDGKKHWVKISRRVDSADSYYRFSVDVALTGRYHAEDAVRVYGATVHLGTGALSAPLYEMSDAAPTAGTWSAGRFFRNDSPVAGGPFGWVCTSSGSPGVWRAVGLVGETIRASTTTDVARIAANTCAPDLTISVVGAAVGAECIAGLPATISPGVLGACFVAAKDTVKLRLCNTTTVASDPPSASYSIRVVNP